jgi:hypothetical protein
LGRPAARAKVVPPTEKITAVNRELAEMKKRLEALRAPDRSNVGEIDTAIRKAERERVLCEFLDEVRKEEYDNCGYVDMDSVEAVYIRLKGEP